MQCSLAMKLFLLLSLQFSREIRHDYSHLKTRFRLETAFVGPVFDAWMLESRQLFNCYSRSLIFHLYYTHSPPRFPRPLNKIDNILGRVTDLPSYQLSSRVPASSRCLFSALRTLHFSVSFIYRLVQNSKFLFIWITKITCLDKNCAIISYEHV